MILGNCLIFHVLPLVWEIVRRTNRLGTRLLCFRNVHLEAPLKMRYCAAFIGCLFSCLWRCIVSTWKRTPGSCVIGEWFMHWTTTPTKCMYSRTTRTSCLLRFMTSAANWHPMCSGGSPVDCSITVCLFFCNDAQMWHP